MGGVQTLLIWTAYVNRTQTWRIVFHYLPVRVYLTSSVDCGEPRPPPHGSLESYTNTMEGLEVFYSCDTSFVPEGRMRSVCTRNGWSPNPADLNCTAGMYMSHGTLVVVRRSKRFGYYRYGVHKNYVPARDSWQMCDHIPLSVGWIVCLYTVHAQYVTTVIFSPGLPTFELFCGPLNTEHVLVLLQIWFKVSAA